MDSLINIELKILRLFKHLCKLEIEGKKHSTKYKNILIDLKNKIKQEELLLKTPEICNITEEKYNEILANASMIDEAIEIRIMARLTGILVKNIGDDADIQEVTISDKIMEEVQNNILLFNAKFLYEFIEKESDEFYRTQLLLEFYDLCYVEPRVGTLLLEDSFELRDDYFRSCYFVADFLGVSRNDAQNLIDESCAELLSLNAISDLFSEKQSVVTNDKKYDFITLLCMTKAIRTIMSEEGFIRYQISSLISIAENNLLTHPNYDLVIRLLSDETKHEEATTITFGKPLRKTKEKDTE